MRGRPDSSEHSEYYAKYVALVPGDDILSAFDAEHVVTMDLLRTITEERSLHRYAEGKWSIREVCVHLSDVERISTYRALRFARNDATELPGYESHEYVPPAAADSRSWSSLVEEFAAVRGATVALFRNLPAEAWLRRGVGGGHPVSVRGLAYIIVGHEIHHRNLLRERYDAG